MALFMVLICEVFQIIFYISCPVTMHGLDMFSGAYLNKWVLPWYPL